MLEALGMLRWNRLRRVQPQLAAARACEDVAQIAKRVGLARDEQKHVRVRAAPRPEYEVAVGCEL